MYSNYKFSIFLLFYFRESESLTYVHHPVNALHMLKRTSKYIPKFVKLIPNFKFAHNLPSVSDAFVGATHGIADIHEHYNLATKGNGLDEIIIDINDFT